MKKDSEHSELFDFQSRPLESEQFVSAVMQRVREENSIWNFLPDISEWGGAAFLGLCALFFIYGGLSQDDEEILLVADLDQYDFFETLELEMEPELLVFEEY